MNKPIVLVTGATGLLGYELIQQLLKQDFKIIACKRSNSDIENFPRSNELSWIDIEDLLKSNYLRLGNVDYVVHAAGLISYSAKDAKALINTNQGLTARVVKWSIQQKVKKFIYISSISALGKKTSNNMIDENTAWDDKQFVSVYGRSKRMGETVVQKASKAGLNYIILNPSVIIGPAPLHKSSASLFKYVYDQKPFYTKGFINYVDVRDLSTLILLSFSHLANNTRYVISGGHTTYRNFFQLIATHLHKRAPFMKIPARLVILGAIVENIYSKITSKKPYLSLETAKMAAKQYVYSSMKLSYHIDYKFYSLNDSIKFTTEAMKNNRYIKL